MLKYECTLDDKDKKVILDLVMWNYFCMRTSFPMEIMLNRNRNMKATFTKKRPLYWHPLVSCWQELREMKKHAEQEKGK